MKKIAISISVVFSICLWACISKNVDNDVPDELEKFAREYINMINNGNLEKA